MSNTAKGGSSASAPTSPAPAPAPRPISAPPTGISLVHNTTGGASAAAAAAAAAAATPSAGASRPDTTGGTPDSDALVRTASARGFAPAPGAAPNQHPQQQQQQQQQGEVRLFHSRGSMDATSADPLRQGSQEDPEEDERPKYTADHLAAVIKPVTITMVLASWVVVHIQQYTQDQAISQGLSVYMVYNENSNASSGTQLLDAIVNAAVIVGVICLMTFLLVLCFKYRCVKFMIAYLIFASASLLGYSGGFVVLTGLSVYNITTDWVTLVFIMYNFAIGGVVAVFYQNGIPRIVTQTYLVLVSVIMAWILTKLPEWTSWTLLVALALYDLCAVLTPCGPLRALIKIAQERPDQPIPGLLYEADVGSVHPENGVRDTFAAGAGKRSQTRGASTTANPEAAASAATPVRTSAVALSDDVEQPAAAAAAPRTPVASLQRVLSGNKRMMDVQRTEELEPLSPKGIEAPRGAAVSNASASHAHGRMDVEDIENETAITIPTSGAASGTASATEAPAGDNYVSMAEAEDEEGAEDAGRSIKLGLGDFVFYSVLVSRGAMFGFVSFASCLVAVVMGLVGTLLLLGLFKKALPALPISIMLGVVFYFTTRLVLFPLVLDMTLAGIVM